MSTYNTAFRARARTLKDRFVKRALDVLAPFVITLMYGVTRRPCSRIRFSVQTNDVFLL